MTTADPTTFGLRFREWSDAWVRAEEGRTFTALAAAVGVDNTLVSHWRAGRVVPDARSSALAALCRVLGLTLDESRTAYALCGVELGPVLDEAEGAAK